MNSRDKSWRLKLLLRIVRITKTSDAVLFLLPEEKFKGRKRLVARKREDFYAKQSLNTDRLLGLYTKNCDPAWIAEDLLALSFLNLGG